MGFRYSRRMTLFPGVRLNFSARGMSVTVGPRGASVNIGPRGAILNLGLPGTGLSFRQPLGSHHPAATPVSSAPEPEALAPVENGTAIASAPVGEVTSEGLLALKELILSVRSERAKLARAISGAERELAVAERRLRRANGWFFGLFLRKRIPERQGVVEARTAELNGLQARMDGAFISTNLGLDGATQEAFRAVEEVFAAVASSARIWDVTSTRDNDRHKTRSAADTSVDRRPVSFRLVEQDEILETASKSLFLQNANGADLIIYPGFCLMQDRSDFALIDLREVTVEYSSSRFIETEGVVPSDAKIVDQTWAKCNKDGSRDRRFANNFQIPVALYGSLTLRSPGGLNEEFMISNAETTGQFARALRDLQDALRRLGERGAAA